LYARSPTRNTTAEWVSRSAAGPKIVALLDREMASLTG
jgi:hypothetical protein